MQLFLSGDVMIGRGIDQILAHPSDPILYESYVKDARDYIKIAEQINGPIPRSVPGAYLWGEALTEFNARPIDAKIINLETSITTENIPWPDKGINYRMHPGNMDALTTAKIDVCVLANNHIFDWGKAGGLTTLKHLDNAKILHAGAGENAIQAYKPAIIPLKEKGRILVFSMGLPTSGIPADWAADSNTPGVYYLHDLSDTSINQVKALIASYRQPDDLCIVSIHWGGNWGYEIPKSHQQFAHALIDEANVKIIHGHSSHHPIGIEIYKNCPIFYGCGDLINDYEGIGSHSEYRDELALLYFLTLNSKQQLSQIELVPMIRKKFSLFYANETDSLWLKNRLQQHSANFGTNFEYQTQRKNPMITIKI